MTETTDTMGTAGRATLAERFFIEAMSPEFREEPYPHYEAYRGAQPLLQVADSMWLCLSHADVATLLRDPRLSTDESRATTSVSEAASGEFRRRSLLFMDPPGHTRLRGLVARAFTPRRVQGLRGTVQAITDELLDGLSARKAARGPGSDAASDSERAAEPVARPAAEPVDLIAAFAYPLPVRVICALLGVPASDEAEFTAWSRAVARAIDPTVLRSPEVDAQIVAAGTELAAYLDGLLEQRRAAPGDDLLSALVAVDADGDRVSSEEAVSLAQLLLIAGHETTVNLIGNGTLALLRNPDQLAVLRARPELVETAVDELLRYDSPVQLTQRVVTEDLDLVGQRVKAGDEIVLVLGAANRDPAAFTEPNRLDVTRADAHRHVAFGGGIHDCLGAALARLEGQIAFAGLLARFPELALAGTPTRRPTFTLRGLATLPVLLG